MAQTLQLGSMGVSQLNSDNAALLGALLDPDPVVGVYPGFVVNVARHQTYVEVDETSTVAAAATGVAGTTAAPASVNLLFTRPFFYAIRDNQTGELLFVGVLMNPSAG
jgi:serine protease inhibitor